MQPVLPTVAGLQRREPLDGAERVHVRPCTLRSELRIELRSELRSELGSELGFGRRAADLSRAAARRAPRRLVPARRGRRGGGRADSEERQHL